ncbi:NAD(P)-dependent dehydrogenase (short-subunit alcohol dehydrogenase family) [Streptomyces sp. 840.1]|uniref:SDR family NAD(P)-dependent oxidoreductase n=1 Tax=Streptomyces sp. 840.1 TaxID=2485152 RepID=UPI000F4A4489|nr:SDR family NAD(P)-dependent oxidoreductase [Streptomyces sp. 840.1]ROQ63331.1 NAD(P)-dependent dehydrogenase (short-subunit alcohol dehydrogenase family) [Streptomyces sp. 840.1]
MITKQRRIGTAFGAHSTADDVLAGIDLTGTTALVTGGYSGLGLETTRALVRAGAHVVVPARRPEAAERALREVPGAEVHALDLADPESIRAFAGRFLDTGRSLGILINSAGIMACPETRTGPGWEAHFAVNHLGHFALVQRLRPALASASGGARVVSVASSGHFLSGIRWDDIHFRTGYDRWLAYAQSKTANALFARHLDSLGSGLGLRAFAVHPGSILTPLQRHIPREEWLAQGWVTPDGAPSAGFKTPQQGAATAVWAATSPLLDGDGGAYCQDCDIAEPATTEDMLVGGVKPWATDREAASRLWELSAGLTGLDAF